LLHSLPSAKNKENIYFNFLNQMLAGSVADVECLSRILILPTRILDLTRRKMRRGKKNNYVTTFV
jgi:hypothetical protein